MITELDVRKVPHYCEAERYVFVLRFESEIAKFSVWGDVPVYEDYSESEVLEYANIVERHIGKQICELIDATKEWHSLSSCSRYHTESETTAELISIASSIPAIAMDIVLESIFKVYYLDDHGTECKVVIKRDTEE